MGQQLLIREESRQIVGVVADVQQVLVRTPGQVESEAVYFPAAQLPDAADLTDLNTPFSSRHRMPGTRS